MSESNDTRAHFYTREEAAELLKVSLSTIGREIRGGKLYAFRVGRGLRVPAQAIEDYAANKVYGSPDDPLACSEHGTYPPTPSILGE